ncbi:hypothetical protein K438DRAFT_1762237 [Mycena galopus ATCC 62051]|nr:hypothetical protein K438DRAFT_1762237 [Mycena galopus ATCC 62051]
MFFAPSLVALITSILPLVSPLILPSGYKNVTTDDLSPLAATSSFVIASQKFGTELNVGYSSTGDGSPVILYAPTTAQAINQQWILNNIVGSPTEYFIESAEAPTFLSFPGAGSSTFSWNAQTIIDATCYPNYTIQQLTPGVNGYRITENMYGGILTAWAQYVQGGAIGMATFQPIVELGAAQVWELYVDPQSLVFCILRVRVIASKCFLKLLRRTDECDLNQVLYSTDVKQEQVAQRQTGYESSSKAQWA